MYIACACFRNGSDDICIFSDFHDFSALRNICYRKVQVGKDQEKAQSEKDSHSKNRDGKKLN